MNKILKIGLITILFIGAILIALGSINYSTEKSESGSQEYQVSSERSEAINNILTAFDNPNIQKGYIVFSFTEKTTKEQAEKILNKYGLKIEQRESCSEIIDPGQPPRQGSCITVSDWVELVKIATVKVPNGEEKEYAKRILENEIQVVSAEPKSTARGGI
ncbi:MAG: hypothetical protein FJZ43_03810 [Candidatus Staskawiczbacteria bacterium]|nr:hypothetical protein [Candidatus Staskawiczbacteria bacterium]